MIIVHYQGDRSPSLADVIAFDGDPFDLTGSTVKFQARLWTSAELAVDASAVVPDPPTSGVVRWDPDADAAALQGFFVGWWLVTLPGGKTQRTPDFPFEMRASGPLPGALCTLEHVRARMDKSAPDVEQDPVIQTLILCASKAIMEYSGREFAPFTQNATRIVMFDPCRLGRNRRIRLMPWDLAELTSARLNPEEPAPTTLTPGVDLRGWNPNRDEPTFTHLALSQYLAVDSDYYRRFGEIQLEVTGDWGFPTVPLDVEGWAVTTVHIWMRSQVQTVTTNYELDTGRLERPESLPSAVRSGLRRWQSPAIR